MDIAQFLKDYGELISISLIPPIIWFIGIRFQNRKEKRDAQINLFLGLMTTRGSVPPSQIWFDNLNQIDVVFQKDKKVRAAWRAYYDSLHPKSQHFDNQSAFQLDLLSEIANVLGYNELKQTEIQRFYSPRVHNYTSARQSALVDENLRVLMHSKSTNEPWSEDELKRHLADLSLKYPELFE